MVNRNICSMICRGRWYDASSLTDGRGHFLHHRKKQELDELVSQLVFNPITRSADGSSFVLYCDAELSHTSRGLRSFPGKRLKSLLKHAINSFYVALYQLYHDASHHQFLP